MENFIVNKDICDAAKDYFLTYAAEVLTDRAIPSAEDGLLSVQRKILWTMEDVLKMDSKSKTKKCASLVGTTLSTAYFHGDASCYGALCKMAQTYLMRYPLIDGQGSLGTQAENGLQASARYTEARPSVFTDLMMLDYKKNIVPTITTYNNEYEEPVMLPGLFPNALVNGREAIGVSMSHSSAPMNLTEVCNGIIRYIKANGEITTKELMEDIKGPDFPLGNVVINQKDIYTIFDTGKSNVSLKVRGDYEIKDDKIIFTSIPYRTYRNKIKEDINKNIDELSKYIDDFDDMSEIGQNRLVFTVKTGVSPLTAVNKLFALTSLQSTISYNMNFIVNGTPKLCSLKDLIKAYVVHQDNIILKIAAYDKAKAEARLHIIKGLLAAIDKIDEVIQLIKSSENKNTAKDKLMKFLSIDEIQAKAILDMTLGKLTRIDKNELIEEAKEQEAIITECIKIESNKNYRDSILIDKITKMRDKYGDARRTKLENITIVKEKGDEPEVEPEKCVVVITDSGLIKRIPATSFKTQKRNGVGVKTQDDITSMVIRTNTVDSLMIFTNKGMMYRLLVDKIPVGTNISRGTSIKSLIEMQPNEEPTIIYSIYKDTEAKYVVFITKEGLIKRTALDEFTKTKKSNGIIATALNDGDELVSAFLATDEDVFVLTKKNMGIRFSLSEVTPSSRIAHGVKAINLAEDDNVRAAAPVRHETDSLAIFSEEGNAKKIPLSEITKQKRAGKGMNYGKIDTPACVAMLSDEDTILIVGDKTSLCVKATDIPTTTRIALGVKMIKNSKVVGVSKV